MIKNFQQEYEKYIKIFPLRLSQLRSQAGFFARRLSIEIGQNNNYINLIENSKSYPSIDSFIYICLYLGFRPDDFFNNDISFPEKIRTILEELKSLDVEQLDIIEDVIRNMKK